MKALIIIPYFGKWPPYTSLFLQSCAKLELLDFLILSDKTFTLALPKNVSVKRITLGEISSLISKKLGINPALNTSYKLCDFKSAYGHIFNHLIGNYAYWGFGDIDLYYGSADKLLKPLFKQNYDVISGRKYWISGALCLFKNTPNVNSLYMTDGFYREVFSDPDHFSFTECSKLWHRLLAGEAWDQIKFPYPNLSLFVLKASHEGKVTTFFDDLIKESIPKGEYIHFHNQMIEDSSGAEYLLFHYIMAKRKPWFTYPDWENIPMEFYITETGFYTKKEFDSWFFGCIELIKKTKKTPVQINSIFNKIIKKLKIT